MRIDIVTLFPEMFSPLNESIIKRAREKNILDINLIQLRDFAFNKHNQVDDTPFGGGSGMVLKPEPMFRAVRSILSDSLSPERRRILIMDPLGQKFNQSKAKELATYEQLIFICGHYEGFDERIYELADEAISIGEYVLTGGELPAMVIIDSVARMIPNVLGSEDSAKTDSFYEGNAGYPQYTKPRDFEGKLVPEVLLSGNHQKIAQWRSEQVAIRNVKFGMWNRC